MHRIRNKAGQTLLLSLLILAGVSAAGIGFATLILHQIQAAENIDNSIYAFYAAQTGLERSLWVVKDSRHDGLPLFSETGPDTIDRIAEMSPGHPIRMGDASVYVDEATPEEESRKFFLEKDESVQIDLFDPDDPFGQNPDPITISHLWISWDNNPCPPTDPGYPCYGTGSEWVEISWTGWTADGSSYNNVEKILLSSLDLSFIDVPADNPLCPSSGTIQCTFFPLDPLPDEDIIYYQVRVKALYDKVEALEVKAVNQISPNQYEPVAIPSRVYVKTIGKYGRTQQALSASLPWRIPASGLLDYVVFTEKELKKEPVEEPYYTSGHIEIERDIENVDEIYGTFPPADPFTFKMCESGPNEGIICDDNSDCTPGTCEPINYCQCPSSTDVGGSSPWCDNGDIDCDDYFIEFPGGGPDWKMRCKNTQLDDPGQTWDAVYWEPEITCRSAREADSYNGYRDLSGWSTCTLLKDSNAGWWNGGFNRCGNGTNWNSQDIRMYTTVSKVIKEEDLPRGNVDYYISFGGLYNSDQNGEELAVYIDKQGTNCSPESEPPNWDDCTKLFLSRDLFSSLANPVWDKFESCYSRDKIGLEVGDRIIFRHETKEGREVRSSVHFDWYQFSTGIPPEIPIGQVCDFEFNSGKIEIENDFEDPMLNEDIDKLSQCSCSGPGDGPEDCDGVGEGDCGTNGWNPKAWGPSAQCFSNQYPTVFPNEENPNSDYWGCYSPCYDDCRFNADWSIKGEHVDCIEECFDPAQNPCIDDANVEDDWYYPSNFWGSCYLDQDRWIEMDVPDNDYFFPDTELVPGDYYLSVGVGLTGVIGVNDEELKVEVYDPSPPNAGLKDILTTKDIWGEDNIPNNSFVACTFPNPVDLEQDYYLKFSSNNSSSPVYVDFFQITSEPYYTPCNMIIRMREVPIQW